MYIIIDMIYIKYTQKYEHQINNVLIVKMFYLDYFASTTVVSSSIASHLTTIISSGT